VRGRETEREIYEKETYRQIYKEPERGPRKRNK